MSSPVDSRISLQIGCVFLFLAGIVVAAAAQDWQRDSIAVRAILDDPQNNLTSLEGATYMRDLMVSSVVTRDPVSGRVTALNLARLAKPLKVFPAATRNLTALASIDLSSNSLNAIPSLSVLAALPALRTLTLESNNFSSIQTDISLLKNITKLNFAGNYITGIPTSLTTMSNLLELDLTKNRIQGISADLYSMNKLQILKLSGNNVDLPTGISAMTSLRELWIQGYDHGNLPRGAPSDLFRLTNLELLSISAVDLSGTISQISALTRLKTLNLNGVGLSTFPEALFSLPALVALNLDNNTIASIPARISSLTNLQTLSIADNHLTALPATFKDMKELRFLLLSSNQLTGAFPNSLTYLDSLQVIDLSRNQLTRLDPCVIAMTNLLYVGLDSNKLCVVSPQLLNWITTFVPSWASTQSGANCSGATSEGTCTRCGDDCSKWGQAGTSLALPAKVRDFSADSRNPDFPAKLSGQTLALGAISETIDTNGAKSIFIGDNRRPVLDHPVSGLYHSNESFAQWYEDVPGINRSFLVTLKFKQISQGIYQYDNSDYFPLDTCSGVDYTALWNRISLNGEKPYGHIASSNACGTGNNHSYYFTTEFHVQFRYQRGQNMTFTFTGDDDTWIFINDKLCADLGGVHFPVGKSVYIDNLGLEDGKVYWLDFFSAERRPVNSNIKIETTFPFIPPSKVPLRAVPGNGGTKPIPFDGGIEVSLETIAGASIWYTTDGSDPADRANTRRKPYKYQFDPVLQKIVTDTLNFTDTTVLRATALLQGYISNSIAETYLLIPHPLSLRASPGDTSYTRSLQVKLSTDSVQGAQIYYTLNGSVPDPGVPVQKYSQPITITGDSVTIRATVVGPFGYTSKDSSWTYRRVWQKTAPPTAAPVSPDSFAILDTIFLTSSTAGATVYYCTGDGCTDFTRYASGGITISGASNVIRAYALGDSALYRRSDTVTFHYKRVYSPSRAVAARYTTSRHDGTVEHIELTIDNTKPKPDLTWIRSNLSALFALPAGLQVSKAELSSDSTTLILSVVQNAYYPQGNSDVLVIKAVAGTADGYVMQGELSIQDGIAPVVLRGYYAPGPGGMSRRGDTLVVRFSEPVEIGALTRQKPFVVIRGQQRFSAQLSVASGNRTDSVVFIVDTLLDNLAYPMRGDSIRIAVPDQVRDLSANAQNDPLNVSRLLSVRYPSVTLTMAAGPNPFTPGESTLPETVRNEMHSPITTGIVLRIKKDTPVPASAFSMQGEVTVYDAVGNAVVRTAPLMTDGDNDLYFVWDGRNSASRRVGSGTYLAILTIRDNSGTNHLYRQKIGVR